MRGVKCLYCGQIAYSAHLPEGKQKCIYCKDEFFISRDQLKQAANPNLPIEGWK